MKDYIEERVLDIAHYVVANKCTVRTAGRVFCVSKSTVHKDLSERLPDLDEQLYRQVSEVLGANWDERYIRGGMATKAKYTQKDNR